MALSLPTFLLARCERQSTTRSAAWHWIPSLAQMWVPYFSGRLHRKCKLCQKIISRFSGHTRSVLEVAVVIMTPTLPASLF